MAESSTSQIELLGIPAAPGRALGPVFVYSRPAVAPATAPARLPGPEAVESEQSRVVVALAAAQSELEQLAIEVEKTVGPSEAAIFTAQSLMAADPMLLERADELVGHELMPADAAIMAAVEEQAVMLATIGDPYLQERAADLRDVGQRAARLARGEAPPADLSRLDHDLILLADDLLPSETMRLDRDNVLGIGLSGGGPTSHVAVVARGMGVPLVCGLGNLSDFEGRVALLDGDAGSLVLDPGEESIAEYGRWLKRHADTQASLALLRDLPAETPDGYRVRLVANAGSLVDAQAAAQYGAEGIGLLRTEFLFAEREPTEEEQFAIYSAVYDALPGREIVVRTMDLGGDKPPPYLDFGDEANPFLGWRGLRVALDKPDMLRTQIRALLRAGAGRAIHVMFPMVSTLDELRLAQACVNEVSTELAHSGVPQASEVHVGVMIEVPAAALLADAFAREVDFFSIGTNDLTQYTMAVDRGSSRVAHLYSPIHPAVLQLIARTASASHRAGRWTGICGEAAGNPAWAPLWVGLGIDELSMTPSSIPAVKEVIRRTRAEDARLLASEALRRATVEEIQSLLTAAS